MLALLLLFFLYSKIDAAEVDEVFIQMKPHIAQCAIGCTDHACAKKGEEQDCTIPNAYYKKRYKDIYRTYHCLSEIDTQNDQFKTDFRLFINGWGELLVCKKSSTFKEDLLLFKRDTHFEHPDYTQDVDYRLGDILRNPNESALNTLRTPSIHVVQASKTVEPNKEQYLYYFLDTTGARNYYTAGKKLLFCIVNLSDLGEKYTASYNKTPRDDFPTIDYRYFLLDNKFKIKALYTNIDLYSNGGNRMVMLCEQEEIEKGWLSHNANKSISLMHIPQRNEEQKCLEGYSGDHMLFDAQTYTIENIKKNHASFGNGDIGKWHEELPLNCYHAQIITGSAEEIENYLKIALKRIELGTTCLHKNEAASSPDCTVYNNPFGEFVVQKNGKAIIIPGYVQRSKLYRAMHNNDDICDEKKMAQCAKDYAEQWGKTVDGRFLYCWEKKPQKVHTTKAWPYGVECGWDGMYSSSTFHGYKNFYASQPNIALRGGGLESFGTHRLWILPLRNHTYSRSQNYSKSVYIHHYNEQRSIVFDLSDPYVIKNGLSFYPIYTDYLYTITHVEGDKLTLNHAASEFDLQVEIPSIKQRYIQEQWPPFNTYLAQVQFDDEKPRQIENSTCLIHLLYKYKNEEKRALFQRHKQEKDDAELAKKKVEETKKELDRKRNMGFLPSNTPQQIASAEEQQKNGSPQQQQPKYNSFLTYFKMRILPHMLKITGGLAIGAIAYSIWWYLQKQHTIGCNYQNDSHRLSRYT